MTREEAIKYIEQHAYIDDEVKDMCIEALGNDTNVGSKWIPIGQYPTEPVLLSFEDGSMAVGYYDESNDVCVCAGVYDYCILEEPIAYMPLPDAYKGK